LSLHLPALAHRMLPWILLSSSVLMLSLPHEQPRKGQQNDVLARVGLEKPRQFHI
jgi:hypothetical protein